MIAVKTRESGHTRFTVAAEADVAAVRRMVSDLVDDLSPGQDRHGRAELVVTELATNLVRHAGGGWMLVRSLRPSSIELIAVDGGRGIDDLAGVLAGQVSDPKGLGCGLRSVRRSSARFDVWTRPGGGTVVLSVLDLGEPGPPPVCAGVSVGIVEPCGDGWAYSDEDGVFTVAVVDGLGHGLKASLATDAALAEFGTDLELFVAQANARMRDTRGAAVTVCRIADGRLRYLAIGNVNGRVVTPEGTRGLVTHGGTLGLHVEPPRSRISTLPFPDGATLVLWTDGLSSRISPAPGLLTHDPAVVAAALHRDHTRNRDDATVVVARPGGAR